MKEKRGEEKKWELRKCQCGPHLEYILGKLVIDKIEWSQNTLG